MVTNSIRRLLQFVVPFYHPGERRMPLTFNTSWLRSCDQIRPASHSVDLASARVDSHSSPGDLPMMPFAAFRRCSRTTLVNRALRLLALATIPAVMGFGLAAEEKPTTTKPQPAIKALPVRVKAAAPASDAEPTVAPSQPLVKLFSSLIGGAEETAKPATPTATEPATHTRQSEFIVKGHDDKGWLQAFAVDSQGRLLAAVGSRVTYGISTASSAPSTREVQVFSAEGKSLEHWPVDFDPQRIAIGPKDEVFVAGSGKIARFSKTGKLISQNDSPHIAAVLGDADALRESAEQQRKQMLASYGEALKSIEQQKGLLEKRIEVPKVIETIVEKLVEKRIEVPKIVDRIVERIVDRQGIRQCGEIADV